MTDKVYSALLGIYVPGAKVATVAYRWLELQIEEVEGAPKLGTLSLKQQVISLRPKGEAVEMPVPDRLLEMLAEKLAAKPVLPAMPASINPPPLEERCKLSEEQHQKLLQMAHERRVWLVDLYAGDRMEKGWPAVLKHYIRPVWDKVLAEAALVKLLPHGGKVELTLTPTEADLKMTSCVELDAKVKSDIEGDDEIPF